MCLLLISVLIIFNIVKKNMKQPISAFLSVIKVGRYIFNLR